MVRAFAEPATVFSPPSNNAGIDLAGLGREVESSPGSTGFAFTTSAHRKLLLRDKEDLVDLISQTLASLDCQWPSARATQEV